MASRYEVEVTIISAKDLKNVNWRSNGKLKPYAVVWIDHNRKCSTRADDGGDGDGGVSPSWDEKLLLPFNSAIEDSTLYIDIVHSAAAADDCTKPIVGSAKLSLRDVVDDVGMGSTADRKLDLKRPSGRPQGKLVVRVSVREPRYRAPEPYYAAPYCVPPPPGSYAPAPYGAPYGAAPPPYGAAPAYGAPPLGYPAYGAPPSYGQPAREQSGQYGQQQGLGYAAPVEEKKKSKFGGVGAGLAVGAVAGALGGLALAEGFDAMKNKVADDVADRVEDDLGYDGDDY
ncbi:hypothetical protein ABFS83_06G107500 [Erythranthe nasuta]